jgi:GT2 family glycosyltransferase
VIPSRNGRDILRDHLPGIIRETADCSGELIVVDDCSTDGTSHFLRAEFPGVRVVERTGEPGFCRGVNLGMSIASGEFLLLLNNDTAPERGSFRGLLGALQDSPAETAAAVPSIPRPDGSDDSLFRWVFRRGLAVTGQFTEGQPYPSGACALWRREAWESLGGLDCRYAPIYWEDTDMGVRMHEMGYRMISCPQFTVKHLHASTMGASPKTLALRERNRFIFMDAHCRGKGMVLRRGLWMPFHLLVALIRGNMAFVRGFGAYLEWRRNR